MDFESKIGGRKPVAHKFCCKREAVATGKQVMAGIATKQRLSLFVETQMDRVRGLPYLALLTHDADFPYRWSGKQPFHPAWSA